MTWCHEPASAGCGCREHRALRMTTQAGRLVFLLALLIGPAALAETDDPLNGSALAALVSHGLVKRPNCIDFSITRNADPGVDGVEILELDNRACGGDPRVVHRLFDVLGDQKTHRMATDAADPVDGHMSALD